jgi:hypothetical protein
MSCFLYFPHKRRNVLSAVLVSQKARCSVRHLFLWLLSSCLTEITALVRSVTHVRSISCRMMRLFCCNQSRSAWIDCSKNSTYEISRKNVGWELHCSMRMDGRSGWRNDGHAHTHAHTCIYTGKRTHTNISLSNAPINCVYMTGQTVDY